MNNLKKCSICKEQKLLTEFSKNKFNNDGLDYVCKCCRKEFNKKVILKKIQRKEIKVKKNKILLTR